MGRIVSVIVTQFLRVRASIDLMGNEGSGCPLFVDMFRNQRTSFNFRGGGLIIWIAATSQSYGRIVKNTKADTNVNCDRRSLQVFRPQDEGSFQQSICSVTEGNHRFASCKYEAKYQASCPTAVAWGNDRCEGIRSNG